MRAVGPAAPPGPDPERSHKPPPLCSTQVFAEKRFGTKMLSRDWDPKCYDKPSSRGHFSAVSLHLTIVS